MNIKNYTSDVPVSTTVSRIEQFLAECRVSSVSKQFTANGEIAALTFRMPTPNGQSCTIRLPANVEKVYRIMMEQVIRPRTGTEQKVRQQASRTAWKLMQDWIQVQVSLIHMNQAEALEVFMPYVWDEQIGQTMYQQLKAGGFKSLPEHCEAQ